MNYRFTSYSTALSYSTSLPREFFFPPFYPQVPFHYLSLSVLRVGLYQFMSTHHLILICCVCERGHLLIGWKIQMHTDSYYVSLSTKLSWRVKPSGRLFVIHIDLMGQILEMELISQSIDRNSCLNVVFCCSNICNNCEILKLTRLFHYMNPQKVP